jgi:tyrosine-protein kinase Etk/Wzc
MAQENDTIDLRDLVLALRRGAGWIAGGAALGLLLALAVTWMLPVRYEATSTVLLRSQSEGQLPDLGRLGGLGGLIPSASGFETELEILTSRSVIGAVVDSLGLQVMVRKPAGMRTDSVLRLARIDPRQEGEVYRFRREAAGYRVVGPGISTVVAPGFPVRLAGAELILREAGLPERFEVQLLDREDVISRVDRSLTARRAGGEVASLVYRDADAQTAAALPNLLVDFYLLRRATSDRGVNQRRYEFLSAQVDSISRELVTAEERLRAYQETSGAVDPMKRGEAEFERAMMLQAQLETSDVEARTLREILNRSTAGGLRTQDLAAYPTFISNAAINDLLSRILDLEVKRLELLQQRTPTDPDVVNLAETRRVLENELTSLARAYLSGLQQQQQEVRRELATYRTALEALPAEGQQSVRLQREVRRLSETLLTLQSQVVGARLAALTEGGDVRRIDVAAAPRNPAFPKLPINLLAGLMVGLTLGAGTALGRAYLGSRLHTAQDVERASGLPATVFNPQMPLLLAPAAERQSLLLLPLGPVDGVGAVARHLAETASLQGRRVAFVDLEPGRVDLPSPERKLSRVAIPLPALQPAPTEQVEDPGYAVHRWQPEAQPRESALQLIEEYERQYPMVIAALPALDRFPTPTLLSPTRSVVFVASEGRLTRTELKDAVQTLSRLGVPVAGVVLRNGHENGADA